MRVLILVILNTVLISLAFAQEKKFIRQGNSSYADKKYEESELKYRKALERKATSFDAAFNLGDALFRQEKFEEAAKQFDNLAHTATSKENRAKAYHNLGNTYMMSKDEQQQPKLKEAVEAYKNALRNNPKDDETRYNLAYAQKLLQQQQQKQNQDKKDQDKKNQDKKDKDKKDQDKKDQDKKKDDQKKKDQDKKDQQDKNKQDQDQKNKPQDQKDQKKQEQKKQQIPKEKAEQMLKALENDEKDLQKKMKMQKVKGQKVKVEKDW